MGNDLISRKDAVSAIDGICATNEKELVIKSLAHTMLLSKSMVPTIDAAPVVHGRWTYFNGGEDVRLGDLDALKDNLFHYAAPEMMWDRGDIEHKIDEMPTIDAIPVEWLNEMKRWAAADGDNECVYVIVFLLDRWQKEQEAQDG